MQGAAPREHAAASPLTLIGGGVSGIGSLRFALGLAGCAALASRPPHAGQRGWSSFSQPLTPERWRPALAGRPWSSGVRSRACRTVAGGARGTVESVADADDPRLALFRTRTRRDHEAYEQQARGLAADALRAAGLAAEAEALERRTGRAPLRRASCVVGVHYSWECLGRLREAMEAGRRLSVGPALIPQGTPEDLVSLAAATCPATYVVAPELLRAELGQETPWHEAPGEHSTDGLPSVGRSPWRRFEPGATRSTCRYAMAFPVSASLRSMRPPFVVLDGLSSASNVGQILRTAYHLGATSVVASGTSWNCLNGRAGRVSLGWLYRMDFHRAEPLGEALAELRQLGVQIYAAENQFSRPVAPHEPSGDRRWALVMGSEDTGVSAEALEMSDFRICVPQQQGLSLNVAHAASICLYELSKHNVMQCGSGAD